MSRKTYKGYGITELRHWARDLKVAGRSKMTGDELVAACFAGARAQVVAAEQAVLAAVTVEPGTLLRHKSTGTIVRVTSTPAPYVRNGVNYESLAFTAEYVELGRRQPGQLRNDVDHANRMDTLSAENGYTIMHMLYQHEAVTCVDCGTPAVRMCQPFGGSQEGQQGPKCERHAGPVRGSLGRPAPATVQRAVQQLNQELRATAPAIARVLEA